MADIKETTNTETTEKPDKHINWDIRFKSALFWTTLIPAVLILIQAVLAIFGITWDFHGLEAHLLAIVEALFAVLAILGVVVDPTTTGVADSERALSYAKQAPNVDSPDADEDK